MSNLIGEIILVFIYFQVVVEEHGETQKLGAPCALDLLMARLHWRFLLRFQRRVSTSDSAAI